MIKDKRMTCAYCKKPIDAKDLWSKGWSPYHAICFLREQSDDEKLLSLVKEIIKLVKK